jgi:hypothetical protein
MGTQENHVRAHRGRSGKRMQMLNVPVTTFNQVGTRHSQECSRESRERP